MPSILFARSTQPWRVTLAMSSSPSTTAGDYLITRKDGVTTTVAATLVWSVAGNTVEIALSEALLPDVVYTILLPGLNPVDFSYRAPLAAPLQKKARTFASQRLGLDLAWASSRALDSRKQVPRRIGEDCLKHDLAALCRIAPREIFHRPLAGVGLDDYVNASDAEQGVVVAKTRAAWTKDPRVTTGSVTLSAEMDPGGELTLTGQVVPGATNEPLDVGV